MATTDRTEKGQFAPSAEEPRVLTRAELQQRRVAARRHGLFARAAPNLRSRTIRVGHLVEQAYRELPDLDRRDEATVRAWARAECRAVDCWARLDVDPTAVQLSDQWRQAEDLARKLRAELFLTPASRLAAARMMSGFRVEEDAANAMAELRSRYGRQAVPASPSASNGHGEALSVSEGER